MENTDNDPTPHNEEEEPKEQFPDAPEEDEDEIIIKAKSAWSRVRKNSTRLWTDWVLIGKALQIGRAYAVSASGSNGPKGKKYSRTFSEWLEGNKLGGMNKNTRADLLKIMDEYDAVDAWHKGLKRDDDNSRLNHPVGVLKAFRARNRREGLRDSTRPPPAPTERQRRMEVEAEADTLRERVQQLETEIKDGGNEYLAEHDNNSEILAALDQRLETADLVEVLNGIIMILHGRGIPRPVIKDPWRSHSRKRATVVEEPIPQEAEVLSQ